MIRYDNKNFPTNDFSLPYKVVGSKIVIKDEDIISTIKTIESIVPKQMTTPIGSHSRSPLNIIGSTPSAVVHEVRKIGRMRRFPASIAASSTEYPDVKRSSSA